MIAHTVADQLRQIDRAVTTLTRSTEALLRATDEFALLDDICRIAVEIAGYQLAWVGYARQDDQRSVFPAAVAGRGRDYVSEITVTWGDDVYGAGPVGAAIRSGGARISVDVESDPRMAPWREQTRKYGFRSLIALPLGHGEERLGALVICSAEADSFDADIVRLLEDLARNLSYGIGALRMKVEHDRAVRELAESENRYRSLIELSPDAVIVHSDGSILFANPAAAQIFGAGQHTLVGRRLNTLVSADDSAPDARLRTEKTLTKLDGGTFEAEIVGAAINFHGIAASLLVVRDVTEQRQVHEQLIQTAKLATLGEMAAGLVHELSQPLNIIRLTAEGALLFIERGKATQEFQSQQFQMIADQSQRTAEIIDDIRIFSRRDSSPVQVFDAAGAVRSALVVLEGQLRPDEITLTTELPQSPVPVRGRRVQLEQVVMNLLSNAHHALKERRERDGADSEARISVAMKMRDGAAVIIVADSGPGIPPDVRARIFEPFFTTKEAGRGTGLGLSVSFGIINSMGGTLELLPGSSGAVFAVTLPVAETAPDAPPPAAAPPQSAGDGHVMIVDDEQAAASTLGRFLQEMGCRVTLCTGGAEAFDKFMADPADVVITDLRMPSGGGEQLVEKLRDFDPLLPIVIVTGHLGATERLADNLRDDRCAVLKKPVALGKLGEIIAAFLLPPEGDEEFIEG